MPTVTELKEERAALVARLRELDLKLAACGVPLGKSDAYAPSHTYDREAVERLIAKWDKERESVPYDPAEWEELERNIGIYEYLHPDAGNEQAAAAGYWSAGAGREARGRRGVRHVV